ncbi:class I SAM-dependent methyltransferase [Caballeronia zhejiangensis]|uniref:class I SAM-dependent methyltransferase n=1 Tax=Caballeronia zhejiangensis TaxID=871203 RepID=UPI001FD62AEF|nr:class I SAM-dependent methyltransferase [Caballeronia zhejiangensis]
MNQDSINLKAYGDKRIVGDFAHGYDLQKPEQVILTKIASDIHGGEILDIGVGCGRTTPALLKISNRYTGIDYSQGMVDVCQDRFPQQRFVVHDARKLDVFPPNHFDLVFFSFNGLDTVGHVDRLDILSKILNILKPDGYFVFSSHNRDFVLFESFLRMIPTIRLSRNPLRTIKRIARLPLLYCRHLRNCTNQVFESEYAIINEPAHEYKMMQYYISIPAQIRQLRSVGFDHRIEAFSAEGKIVAHDSESGWIYYVSRKG